MALPKRRISRTRGKKRRTNWKISITGLAKCGNCGEYIIPHTVCPYCGYYRDKIVKSIEVKEK